MPKASKSFPKSNKSPHLVTLLETEGEHTGWHLGRRGQIFLLDLDKGTATMPSIVAVTCFIYENPVFTTSLIGSIGTIICLVPTNEE